MDINQKCINELKFLSAQIVSNAKSGHTGSAIGASSIIYALFKDHLMFNPQNPNFLNRDRLIFSAGHVSALYYSVLHLFGYDISSEDLRNFRVCGSKTPGHPEVHITPGIEVSTGPLGQGIANAVGFAIAQANLQARLETLNSKIIDNYTYCFTGDGCLMEGVALEACSLAGTLALNKLILLYDNNDITIDGTRQLSNSEDIAAKFKAMHWNVLFVNKGNDYRACSKAIKIAKNSNKPTIIIFKTTIGLGTAHQGTAKMHSYPMPTDELIQFKKSLNVDNDFGFSKDVVLHCQKTIEKNISKYDKWNNYLIDLKVNDKQKYKLFKQITETKPINFEKLVEKLNNNLNIAGRNAANEILNLVAKTDNSLLGGAADVAASTLSKINDGGNFSATNKLGRNIHFGIREHAMAAICNGISLYNNTPSFCSTFLAFSNYMIPALRMSALMNVPVLSIFSHDSINVGQDGPTHQPIEQLTMLRSIVDLQTFRPSNKIETLAAFKYFYENKKPTAIVVSKSKQNNIAVSLEDASKGAYIAYQNAKNPEIVIISSGTEVELSVKVAKLLENKNVRVVSVPCENIFSNQPTAYKKKILANPKLTVVIEASNENVWYKYLNNNDLIFNVNSYQSSGDGNEIYKKAGFDENKIAQKIIKNLK